MKKLTIVFSTVLLAAQLTASISYAGEVDKHTKKASKAERTKFITGPVSGGDLSGGEAMVKEHKKRKSKKGIWEERLKFTSIAGPVLTPNDGSEDESSIKKHKKKPSKRTYVPSPRLIKDPGNNGGAAGDEVLINRHSKQKTASIKIVPPREKL